MREPSGASERRAPRRNRGAKRSPRPPRRCPPPAPSHSTPTSSRRPFLRPFHRPAIRAVDEHDAGPADRGEHALAQRRSSPTSASRSGIVTHGSKPPSSRTPFAAGGDSSRLTSSASTKPRPVSASSSETASNSAFACDRCGLRPRRELLRRRGPEDAEEAPHELGARLRERHPRRLRQRERRLLRHVGDLEQSRACARTPGARGGSGSSAHHGSSPLRHALAQRLVEVVAPQRPVREPVAGGVDHDLHRLRHLEPLVARLLRVHRAHERLQLPRVLRHERRREHAGVAARHDVRRAAERVDLDHVAGHRLERARRAAPPARPTRAGTAAARSRPPPRSPRPAGRGGAPRRGTRAPDRRRPPRPQA